MGQTYALQDPYRFPPTIGEMDVYLFNEGRHEALWTVLGSHPRVLDGVAGTSFAVWAPSARGVAVVGDFNAWDGRLHPMRAIGASGVWELFVPGVEAGQRYKYEIRRQDGGLQLRADPFAFETEMPPETASVVHALPEAAGVQRGDGPPLREPMSVYEVHLGSWKRDPSEPDRWLSYGELADQLART
jgi:1,4-alpha-glucan branching enzyme